MREKINGIHLIAFLYINYRLFTFFLNSNNNGKGIYIISYNHTLTVMHLMVVACRPN